MNQETLIRFDNVSIGYDGKSILNGIDISIRENQFLGVLGANGGGKTTFIKTVMGLIPQIDGEIKRKNKVVFGYVPQHEKFDPIFPASVVEIVTMGRYSRVSFGKRINKIDKDIVEESMDKVGISKIKNSVFSSLSGGEKQRVLIARALSSEPDLLILDEPTASVDRKGEEEIISLIVQANENNEFAVIMVSHYLNSIRNLGDNFVVVDKEENKFFIYDKNGLSDNTLL